MSFLYENIAPIAVALAVATVTWLFGGARGDLLIPVVPWILLLLTEVLVCCPQRRHGETTYMARERMWRSLRRSPVFWTATGFVVLLLVPFVNNGLCPGCDAELIAQGLDPRPPVSLLPFCVNRTDHLAIVLAFAVALLAAVIACHGMTDKGKRLVLELIVWNGSAVALFGFVQGAFGAPGPFWQAMAGASAGAKGVFFSVFGYPNMAGDYFTLLFGISVALWRDHYEESVQNESVRQADSVHSHVRRCEQFWERHYFTLPAALFFFAAINTLSRAAILLVTAVACICFLHTLVVLLFRMKRSRRVIVGVWSVLSLSLLVFFATIFMPDDLHREVDSLDDTACLDRVTGKGQYHATVATAIWRDHLLFGCGGWGYKHFSVSKMEELKIPTSHVQRVGGANVHNDYLQFLAEHGLVGLGALVALGLMLVFPVFRRWRELVRESRFNRKQAKLPKPIALFILPAPVFVLLLTALATLVHAFGDCPLRSCAVLALFYVLLAAMPGFLSSPTPNGSSHAAR